MNQLDPSIKTIWSLRILIRALVNAGIFYAAEHFFIVPNFEWPLHAGIIPGALFLLGIIWSILIPYLQYKYWKFDIRDTEIYIEYGVLTRVKTTAPYSRVQHLDVRQSLFERMMHLSSLVVYTAGTRGSDLTIPGLPEDYAEQLRDELKNITAEDEL